jgi:hypothetical protein
MIGGIVGGNSPNKQVKAINGISTASSATRTYKVGDSHSPLAVTWWVTSRITRQNLNTKKSNMLDFTQF